MTSTTSPDEFIRLAEQNAVIDVRSPGEFSRGHIPGAHNVCLLDDNERAEVGITYKQRGREAAIGLGRRIVEPKIPDMLDAVGRIATSGNVLVHCWRGGLRSKSVADLLAENGFRPRTLEGGYKAFRNAAHRCFAEPRRVVLLGGLTGCGKTELLHELQRLGEQIIDLEGLANHRGSAFGGIGMPPQPTVEQFENELFYQWRKLDPTNPVWIESENHVIGRVPVPEDIWAQMLAAPHIRVEVDRVTRVTRLLEEYGGYSKEALQSGVNAIKKRLGGERHRAALEALERGELHSLAELVLDYYDRAYERAQESLIGPGSRSVRLSEDVVQSLPTLARQMLGD